MLPTYPGDDTGVFKLEVVYATHPAVTNAAQVGLVQYKVHVPPLVQKSVTVDAHAILPEGVVGVGVTVGVLVIVIVGVIVGVILG
ncbi:MAG: hypothetical protein ACK55I_47345, partial [bacterium]